MKLSIHHKTGVPLSHQVLKFRGISLNENLPLSNFGIQIESTIKLWGHIRGGALVDNLCSGDESDIVMLKGVSHSVATDNNNTAEASHNIGEILIITNMTPPPILHQQDATVYPRHLI